MTPYEFAEKIITEASFIPKGRSYNAVDCWGVVFLGYRDVLGIDLPSYDEKYSRKDVLGTDRLGDLVKRNMGGWFRVCASPEPMDVALFSIDGLPVHVGLLLDIRIRRVLHAEKVNGVFVERLDIPLWANRLEGIYRYER
jgi:hypothetical protein